MSDWNKVIQSEAFQALSADTQPMTHNTTQPEQPASPSGLVEVVAELQLAAFLAGRGSVTSMQHGTRSAKPAPSMDEFRNMAAAALAAPATADSEHPLARMVALDEQIEADNPGWMTGDATPVAPSNQEAQSALIDLLDCKCGREECLYLAAREEIIRLTALKPEVVAAERERCAKIARDYGSKARQRGWVTNPESAGLAADHIAAAIRASVSTKGSCDG